MDGEAALAQRREEERGEDDAERIVAADERDGDAEESGAAREAILVVVLIAEDEVDATDAGDRAAPGERAEEDATDVDAAVFRRIGLQTDGGVYADLIGRER